MDTHYLRITDKAVIESNLEDECDYQFTGVISTNGKNTTPDGEGGNSVTWKAKFTGEVSLIKGDKTMVRGKKKGSMADQLYRVLLKEATMLGEEPQEYYEKQMKLIIESREKYV